MSPRSLRGESGRPDSSYLLILQERRRTAYRNLRRHCGVDRRTGDEPSGHDKRLCPGGSGLQYEYLHPVFPCGGNDVRHLCGSGLGILLLNFIWQLFRNFGLGIGLEAEDPLKLTFRTILFMGLVFFSQDIVNLILDIGGTPYEWIVDASLPLLPARMQQRKQRPIRPRPLLITCKPGKTGSP